jgi:hypothetical protein
MYSRKVQIKNTMQIRSSKRGAKRSTWLFGYGLEGYLVASSVYVGKRLHRKEHTKGRDFHGKSLKRSFVPSLPTHPIKNLHDIWREGFKSEDLGKVTCALSSALSFRNTHLNTHPKGERGTYHRRAHRRTRQQAHTPPAKGQSSNPGSVHPNGEKTYNA